MANLTTLFAVVILLIHCIGISSARNSVYPREKKCDKNIVSDAFKDLNIQEELNDCKSKADLIKSLSQEFNIFGVNAGTLPKEVSKFCTKASCKAVIKAIIKGPNFALTDCINSDGFNFGGKLLKLNQACEVFNPSTSSPLSTSSPSPTLAPPSYPGTTSAPSTPDPPTPAPTPQETTNPTTEIPAPTPTTSSTAPENSVPTPQETTNPTTETPSPTPTTSSTAPETSVPTTQKPTKLTTETPSPTNSTSKTIVTITLKRDPTTQNPTPIPSTSSTAPETSGPSTQEPTKPTTEILAPTPTTSSTAIYTYVPQVPTTPILTPILDPWSTPIQWGILSPQIPAYQIPPIIKQEVISSPVQKIKKSIPLVVKKSKPSAPKLPRVRPFKAPVQSKNHIASRNRNPSKNKVKKKKW